EERQRQRHREHDAGEPHDGAANRPARPRHLEFAGADEVNAPRGQGQFEAATHDAPPGSVPGKYGLFFRAVPLAALRNSTSGSDRGEIALRVYSPYNSTL